MQIVTSLRQHRFLAMAVVGSLTAAIFLLIRGDGNAAYLANQKAEDEKVRMSMNAAAAARTISTPWPIASPAPTTSALSDREQTERSTALGMALKVSEPVNEILRITDESLRYIHSLSGVKKLSRMEYLYLASTVIEQSAKEPDPKQRLKKDKMGKLSFSEISRIVNRIATAASGLD